MCMSSERVRRAVDHAYLQGDNPATWRTQPASSCVRRPLTSPRGGGDERCVYHRACERAGNPARTRCITATGQMHPYSAMHLFGTMHPASPQSRAHPRHYHGIVLGVYQYERVRPSHCTPRASDHAIRSDAAGRCDLIATSPHDPGMRIFLCVLPTVKFSMLSTFVA
ncbi:hypothetical protein PLICRDRAFT_646291 [Plicaturopsis crispa FD-325 SS-3]|nr:hypothetical protein PLICRDRAFT_646291 [Plicaturopsis crispa FD-325 SS-3]